MRESFKYCGKILQKFLFKMGVQFDLIRPSNDIEKALVLLLSTRGIASLIDIGANRGQFGKRVRDLGYQGDLLCIEPLTSLRKDLEKFAKKFSRTQIMTGVAVSNKVGSRKFNISKNSVSSSLNKIMDRHTYSALDSAYISTQDVELVTLPTLISSFSGDEAVAVKIDVQGHENVIIEDIKKSDLRTVKIIQLELSKVHLYEGSSVDKELIPILEDLGFTLFSLGCGFSDPITGEMLQYDAIYVRD